MRPRHDSKDCRVDANSPVILANAILLFTPSEEGKTLLRDAVRVKKNPTVVTSCMQVEGVSAFTSLNDVLSALLARPECLLLPAGVERVHDPAFRSAPHRPFHFGDPLPLPPGVQWAMVSAEIPESLQRLLRGADG